MYPPCYIRDRQREDKLNYGKDIYADRVRMCCNFYGYFYFVFIQCSAIIQD